MFISKTFVVFFVFVSFFSRYYSRFSMSNKILNYKTKQLDRTRYLTNYYDYWYFLMAAFNVCFFLKRFAWNILCLWVNYKIRRISYRNKLDRLKQTFLIISRRDSESIFIHRSFTSIVQSSVNGSSSFISKQLLYKSFWGHAFDHTLILNNI